MTGILITNPAHDDVTTYLFHWSREIKELAEAKFRSVKEFMQKDVTRSNIESYIRKANPKFVIFHGHGNYDQICGFEKNEVLIKSGINDNHLSGKIIHSVTCNSAESLGPSAVKKGALAFVGFDDEFYFPYNPLLASKPMDDVTAACSMEPIMQFSRSIIKSNTVKEAYEKSQNVFVKWLEKCHSSDAPYELEGVAPFISWNMNHQKVIGDNSAKL